MAHHIAEMTVNRDYTSEEIADLKDQLYKKWKEKKENEDDFDNVKRVHSNQIKEFKKEMLEVYEKIKLGHEEIKVTCNAVPDYELNIMQFVDIETNEIYDDLARPMLPGERQIAADFESNIIDINETKTG